MCNDPFDGNEWQAGYIVALFPQVPSDGSMAVYDELCSGGKNLKVQNAPSSL